jgi:mono/diheme cytochrome c family protein
MAHVLRLSAAALLFSSMIAPVSAADPADEFKTKVWPIIEGSCTSCHGEKKQKGKLRLDTREGWLKGGENGKIAEEGHPEKSEVITSVKWESKDEDKNMPPKKDKKLSAEQVAILEAWIKAGMPWGK